jgi:hypothetical protein
MPFGMFCMSSGYGMPLNVDKNWVGSFQGKPSCEAGSDFSRGGIFFIIAIFLSDQTKSLSIEIDGLLWRNESQNFGFVERADVDPERGVAADDAEHDGGLRVVGLRRGVGEAGEDAGVEGVFGVAPGGGGFPEPGLQAEREGACGGIGRAGSGSVLV